MARARRLPLTVYMNSIPVGVWSITSSGEHQFRYFSSWLDSAQARPISLSLPLISAADHHSGSVVEQFFDNLLPDTPSLRKRLQTRFHTGTHSAYDLITAVGSDCLGAVQILPEAPASRNCLQILPEAPASRNCLQILPEAHEEPEPAYTITGQAVTESEIARILRETVLSRSTLGSLRSFRISLAGAQEKTSFCFHDGNWLIPLGQTPSTHIFKLPIGDIGIADMSDSLENEHLCSRLFANFGIPTAETEIQSFEDEKVLIVTRFDRRVSPGGRIIRLPHEDFCQATGTPSALKYESDGGPGIQTIMGILSSARDPRNDRLLLLKALMLDWLLAAPDAHAKNFSIALLAGGMFSLAPVYDITSAPIFMELTNP